MFPRSTDKRRSPCKRQAGVALILALVMLLIMTLVATVAMRTTTMDLKMTSNTALAKRAFQASEGGRMILGPMLDAHVFNRGWPTTVDGGTVPGSASFPMPVEIDIFMGGRATPGTYRLYMGDNGCLYADACAEFSQDSSSATRRDEDIRFRAEVPTGTANVLEQHEIYSDVWVTRVASLPAPGSGAAQGSGYLGPGVGAAGAGAHVYLDIRSEGEVLGNASARTGADYRVLVRN